MKATLVGIFTILLFLTINPVAQSNDATQYWLKLRAKDSFQRSLIADTGAAIEQIEGDYVIALSSAASKYDLEKLGLVIEAVPSLWSLDFPAADADYHNYFEMEEALFNLNAEYPDITRLSSIGQSYEGRSIWNLQISGKLADSKNLPAILYVGGHHAREHLSVEIPLMFAKHLLQSYKNGDARIVKLLNERNVYIIPALNPDGLEYDISTGKYLFWRKNRRVNNDRSYGVDLNRNYGYKWGTGGSSRRPSDETFMGTAPFSEPETKAIKEFIDQTPNINVILSFHTFSELILYPWGWTNSRIADEKPRRIFETMARKMATWNGYQAQQSSDLYVASGDFTDWAFGEHGIIAFTFELDPKGGYDRGGFYPGAKIIPEVFRKNLEPALYLLDMASNPERALTAK